MNTYTKLKNFAVVGVFSAGIAGIEINADTGLEPVHELSPYTVEGKEPWYWESPERSDRLLFSGEVGRFAQFVGWEAMMEGGVSGLDDLVIELPGVTQQARFGVMTVPTIRGDAAETLFNGQRRGDNLFGMPLSLSPVAGIEVVNGVGLLSTGPGKRSGGQLNVVTLTPVPELNRGEAFLRLGTWVPDGGSFSTVEGRLRANLPLGEKQALAVALGWRDNATFYRRNGGEDDQQDLYLAWRREGMRTDMDIIAYAQSVSQPQSLGVNRPWQGLIDEGLYIRGEVDATIGLGDPPGFFDPGIADPGLLTAGSEDLETIARDRVLMSEGDVGEGDLALLQGRARVQLGMDLEFAQSFLVERVLREKLNQFYYAEDVEQLTLDSMSALSGTLGTTDWEMGVHLRLEERDNRANYWNEFAYAWDILTARRFNALSDLSAGIAPGAASGAGERPWYVPSSLFSTPESTVSKLEQAGLYGQLAQAFGEHWTLKWGGRVDHFDAAAEEPAELSDLALSDSASTTLWSGSVTLTYAQPTYTAYLSYANLGGVSGNTVGDGINLYGEQGIHEEDLRNRNRLAEMGLRARLSENWALQAALFDQRRNRVEFFGRNALQTRGIEGSLDGQLGERTRFGFVAHYIDARYRNAAPAEFGGGSLWNVFAAGAGPTGEGTGLGYTQGFFLNSVLPGDHRIPGISRWETAFHVHQAFTDNLSVRLQGQIRGPQIGNLAAEYRIPQQTEWNAVIGYQAETWEAQVIVYNVFDADNWIHNGDTYFDQLLISRNLPRRLEFWIRWWW